MPGSPRRFALLLVKPSHYDDDGYVIQWFRSAIPSNSLAALYGLAQDCAARRVLGEEVELEIHAFDETNTRIRADRLARMIEHAGSGMVMLVGVQSNQFPRALDIARPLRAARHRGRHRRVPCLRHGCDARRRRSRSGARAGARRVAVRRRGRGQARGGAARCLGGRPQAALQLYGRSARDRRRADPAAAARAGQAHRRRRHQLRCRARLPLPVLVLHHHQCARPQVAPALARRHRALGARQPEAGSRPLLHHRRQFRPQQGLGADPRPSDPAAPAGRAQVQHHHPGRYAVPQAAGLHREMCARRRQARLHRA